MTDPTQIRVEPCTVDAFTIYSPSGLDPINVFIQDFGGGQGRLTIECYGRAWSTYWGGMGSESLRAFILTCHASYIVNRLENDGRSMTALRKERPYLTRIVEAIQSAVTPLAVQDATPMKGQQQ